MSAVVEVRLGETLATLAADVEQSPSAYRCTGHLPPATGCWWYSRR